MKQQSNGEEYLAVDSRLFYRCISRALGEVHDCPVLMINLV